MIASELSKLNSLLLLNIKHDDDPVSVSPPTQLPFHTSPAVEVILYTSHLPKELIWTVQP